jgi:hypothetical protein
VFGLPIAHHDPPVHRVPVHDQMDLPVQVAGQPLQERQEHRAGE